MLQIVYCRNCNKDGLFDIQLTFTEWRKHCNCCENLKTISSDMHSFCNVDCMMEWLRVNEVEEKGLPCFSCTNLWDGFSQIVQPTGWLATFERNGPCNVCKGKKRLKKSITSTEYYEVAPAILTTKK